MSSTQAARYLSALLALGASRLAAEEPAAPPPPQVAAASPADAGGAKAIEAVVAEFVRAFDAGDAKAVAALFTEGAKIDTEGSPPVEGRAAIEKLFADRFEVEPGRTIAVKTGSIRMLGPDAAVEEGSAAIAAPADPADASPDVVAYRYTAAYVRKDGRWLQDNIHDFPAPPAAEPEKSAHDRLAELEWLVGEWIDEDDDAEVHTTCEWAEEGAFLIRKFRVMVGRSAVMSGVQRIGWDARQKQLRSWTFDSEGGFAEGLWSREPGADRWVVKSSGVLKDGRAASATNVLTREGRDVLRWDSADRTVGDSALPDAERITLVRRPPAPRSAAAATTSARPSVDGGSKP